MVLYTGNENGWTGAATPVRLLDAHIDMTAPEEFPLLKAVGMNSLDMVLNNTKFEWQMDEFVPITDALNGAVSNTSVSEITVDNAAAFVLHDVIMIDSELLRVLAVDTTNNKLTVERGFAGSTAATHSDDASVHRLGPARPEGSSPGWAQQTSLVRPYNYTQIWDLTVGISGTQKAVNNYTANDLMAFRLDKRMRELYQMMEKALIYNLRYENPTVNDGRMSGGLAQFIHDVNNLAGADLTYSDVEGYLEEVFQRAGISNVPNQIWGNSTVKKIINDWQTVTNVVRTENVIGSEINTIVTSFGSLDIIMDHLIKTNEAYLINRELIQMGPLQGRGFFSMDATPPGVDGIQERVLGEYGFAVRGENGSDDGLHVKLYGFDIS